MFELSTKIYNRHPWLGYVLAPVMGVALTLAVGIVARVPGALSALISG